MTTRIYYPDTIILNQEIILTAQAGQHLIRVLRLKTHDKFIIFNGRENGEFEAIITNIQKEKVTARATLFKSTIMESPVKIFLGQGISRGERMDYVVQKATELGVFQIIPLFTDFCNVQLDNSRGEKRIAHWQKIAISASEQSDRTSIPIIALPQLFHDWVKDLSGMKIICDPDSKNKWREITLPHTPQDIYLLIGPEGGFSPQETELARKFDFQSVSLGPRILRTETAPVVALTLIQSVLGDI